MHRKKQIIGKVMVQNVPFSFNVNIYDKILILTRSSSPHCHSTTYYILKQSETTQNPLHQVKEMI